MPTNFNGIDGVQKIPQWVTSGINEEAIKFAEEFGKDLANNDLSTSQIRNVFSEIKYIQMHGEKDFLITPLLLLKPKLAYAKKRKASGKAAKAAEDLEKVLGKGIDTIVAGKNQFLLFENFANLFEAILAYHKAYGGK